MADHLRDEHGNNVGRLANYSLNRSAIPVDPRSTDGQIPTFSANVADLETAPRSLAGKKVTLQDWTGTDSFGQVAGVKTSNKTTASLDVYTIFERLNSKVTVLPHVATNKAQVLEHWCLMAGVPRWRVPDNLLQYVPSDSRFGYIADSISKWANSSAWGSVAGAQTAYTPTATAYTAPIEVNPSQSIVLGGMFKNSQTLSEMVWECWVPLLQKTYQFILRRNGNTWTVRQYDYATTQILLSTTYTIQGTANSDPFVCLLVKANADATKADLTLRFIEAGEDQFTPSNQDVSTTVTATGVTTVLRNRPLPKTVLLGYDPALGGSHPVKGAPHFAFLSQAEVLPTEYPTRQVWLGSPSNDGTPLNGVGTMNACPGFTDNLWNRLREFCSVYEIDADFQKDAIVFQDRKWARTDKGTGAFIPAPPIRKGRVSEDVNDREKARRVEVVYSKYTGTPSQYDSELLWKADQVYSLEKGETKEEVIQTDSTFITLNQPVPVSGVPVPYTWSYGSYVITGNDGWIVDPQWWVDNGGSIKVEQTGKSGEIKLVMQAPTIDTVRAPYRISEGQADRPALYIVGRGIKTEKVTLPCYTGNGDAAEDVGVTFEAPFITNAEVAMNTCFKLATHFSGADSSINFRVAKEDMRTTQSVFGGAIEHWPHESGDFSEQGAAAFEKLPLNDSVYWEGSYFRIKDMSLTPTGYNVTKTEKYNTISVINAEMGSGFTVADWNALHAGKTIREIDLSPLPMHEG